MADVPLLTALTASALVVLTACSGAGETGVASSGSTAKPLTATATLSAADGSARGTVQAVQETNGVKFTVMAENIPAGIHGAHIHTTGACTAPDFASAGGHWNPTGAKHGSMNPDGAHKGDLPNVTVEANGKGMVEFTVPGVTISGGEYPLLDADGAAFVIHAGPDDLKSDPAGNSGGRIACGVFQPA